jgi:hypothetical protein
MSEDLKIPDHKAEIERDILSTIRNDPDKIHVAKFEYRDDNETNPATFTLEIEVKGGERPYAIINMIQGGGNLGRALAATIAGYTFLAYNLISLKVPIHMFYSAQRGAKVSKNTVSVLNYSNPSVGDFKSILNSSLHSVYLHNVLDDGIFLIVSEATTRLNIKRVIDLGVQVPLEVVEQEKDKIRGFVSES